MANNNLVTVRLRHQLPGYSVGEVVGFTPAVAERLVEDFYAEYYTVDSAESEAETEPAGEEEGSGKRRTLNRKQMSTSAGPAYMTK